MRSLCIVHKQDFSVIFISLEKGDGPVRRFFVGSVRIICALLSLVSALTLTSCGSAQSALTKKALNSAEASIEQGTPYSGQDLLQVENEGLILRLDSKNCNVEIINKADGSVWASNPASDYEDAVASGSYKTEIKAQLLVTYTTGVNAAQRQSNSYSSSVSKGNFKIFKLQDGFRVHYTFNEGFVIPVAYRLVDGRFSASVLYDEIEEKKQENILNEITLLPYFATASANDTGYIFVPDGSGALIELNNGKTQAPSYKKAIYGQDPTLQDAIESNRQTEIRIPVFGMKRGDGAFVATVTSGDGHAYIQASVAGGKTMFNTVNVCGSYRIASLVYMFESSSGSRNVLYNAQDTNSAQALTVEYTFLSGEDADYNGMAKAYRERLQKSFRGANGTAPALHIDLYGQVAIKKTFLGIQYQGINALTTFSQASKIVNALTESGVSGMAVGYREYGKDSLRSSAEVSLSLSDKLGGKKAFSGFLDTAESSDASVALHSNILYTGRSANGVSRFFDTSKNINLGKAIFSRRGYNTNVKDETLVQPCLIDPHMYETLVMRLYKSADKAEIGGLYFTDTAQYLATDFSPGGVGRQGSIQILSALMEQLSRDYSLTFADPNGYLYPYAKLLVDIPLKSSSHLLFDCDVPFLQYVLSGNVAYYATPLNESSNPTESFLLQAETMSGVRYAFMYGDASLLKRTEMIDRYALSFAQWKDDAAYYALAMQKLQATVGGAQMISHQKSDGLAHTVYSNGISVYVNYNLSPVTVDGVTVQPLGYTVASGGEVLLQETLKEVDS